MPDGWFVLGPNGQTVGPYTDADLTSESLQLLSQRLMAW